jgi:transcriptional regulator with XRE-family HTH domain
VSRITKSGKDKDKRTSLGLRARSDELDAEIGRRIRAHRVMRQMSQTKLAAAVGVTFQQIQKYEKGRNRVAPGRLQKIADAVGVSVAKFYPSMDRQRSDNGGGDIYALMGSFGAVGMARAYAALRPSCQIALHALARSMAARPDLRKRGKNGSPVDWIEREDSDSGSDGAGAHASGAIELHSGSPGRGQGGRQARRS